MSTLKSIIEFYKDDRVITSVKSSVRLQENDLISIRGIEYKVVFVSYAVDNADDYFLRQMRSNVTVILNN